MALAAGLPRQKFDGQDLIVATLAETLAQTGKPSVLIVTGSQDDLNKLSEQVKGLGYVSAGGITAEAALDLAEALGTTPRLWMNLQATFDLDAAIEKRRRAA